ncbi:hypothetical protein IEO21_01776 [Rhodonia placenta]|uniref:Tethering factor for nuclear proteasome STS1 n=1 Tax=Rhodonia placenta TaxID=104341 RepID=A0A8H7U509_9APHY|nr:hypothetical protein IEO21_01776 [Postia placenta]
MTSWPTAPAHTPQSSWPFATSVQSPVTRATKRRHEPEEESENRSARDDEMERSPTPERPKRAAPKRARTTPALLLATKNEEGAKETKASTTTEDVDVDVGVLLASLPPQSLLPLLSSLLVAQPSLKSTILSLIPRPTLETALQALATAANKLRDAYPYSSPPFSQGTPSTSFGFGSCAYGPQRRPNSSGFGAGRPSYGPSGSSTNGMRDEYILSRLRPHISEYISACYSYLPYFSYAATPSDVGASGAHMSQRQSHAAALQSQHKDRSHPTETFLFLSSLTSHILSQPPLTQSALVPQILPRLTEEWKAWVDRVDQVVNLEGGMFGSETVRTWESGLDDYAQAKWEGSEVMRQMRDHWVAKVGWLVGRQPVQPMEEL